MKLAIITVLLAVSMNFVAQAERIEFSNLEPITWDASPKWEVLDSTMKDEPEVILMYERFIEFGYSSEFGNRLVEYYTIHKKIRVNSDEAIEYNNKVYIGFNSALRLEDAKARVIKPDGKIIDFDTSNIQSSDGGEDKSAHKYFAIDGIEKGSDVEYTYTLLKIPSVEGKRITLQDEYIMRNVDFRLICPDNLLFKFKTYNGLPEVYLDSNRYDKNIYRTNVDQISKLKEEDYAPYDRSLMYLIYKLEANKGSGKSNLVTFGDISQSIFEVYYGPLEKGDVKAINKLINQSGAKNEPTTDAKIRKLEAYIKSNIFVLEGLPFNSIKDAVKYKFTSDYVLGKIFAHAFDILGIESEIVLTTDRYENYFDESFENHHVLQNIMFYIPETKKYLVPDDFSYRYGLYPDEWGSQKGLFIKKVTVGDISTGVGKVKDIKAVDASVTKDIMEVTFGFEDITEPVALFRRELSGYSACYFQPYYPSMDSLARKELDENYIKFVDQNGEVLEYKVSGVEEEDIQVNPVVYEGKIKTSTIMEKAGNKYLFKIGESIGPQAEMYDETERKMDIEHNHNMTYERKITFTVPDGYNLAGIEALKINEVYPKEDPKIGFISDYERNGDEVVVTVTEFYYEIQFKKSEIDDFRRIINAAANFNKVVLFLEKN
ncbi:MAG: DUF3857 domain-containing protein [Flavobacteriales bacterium]|nr:DUF3857 domain-containing protein [Flavobacteriales bacterium]MCB9197041.1 DUF3857 domain-containing protein [Flavobacteriales bacterium]